MILFAIDWRVRIKGARQFSVALTMRGSLVNCQYRLDNTHQSNRRLQTLSLLGIPREVGQVDPMPRPLSVEWRARGGFGGRQPKKSRSDRVAGGL
jgi:hypothetical protein